MECGASRELNSHVQYEFPKGPFYLVRSQLENQEKQTQLETQSSTSQLPLHCGINFFPLKTPSLWCVDTAAHTHCNSLETDLHNAYEKVGLHFFLPEALRGPSPLVSLALCCHQTQLWGLGCAFSLSARVEQAPMKQKYALPMMDSNGAQYVNAYYCKPLRT